MKSFMPTIAGIASHGSSTRLLGQRKGVPVHMALSPGEYLSSLWLRVDGAACIVRSPYLISVRSEHIAQNLLVVEIYYP